MLLAVLLSFVVWSNPPPVLYACVPGHANLVTPSNCQRVPTHVLGKFPLP